MKKLVTIISMLFCVACLCACQATQPIEPVASTESGVVTESGVATESGVTTTESGVASTDSGENEEDKKLEEAKKQEEAKKAEEEKKAKEEAEKLAKEKEAEDAFFLGIADDVDRTKVVKLDKETIMYTTRSANVRKGPSKEYDKAGGLGANVKTTVVGRYEEKGWYMIEYKDEHAFISDALLSENEIDLDALKTIEEAKALAAIQQQQAAQAAAAQQQQAQTQAPAPAPAQAPAQAAPAAPVQASAGVLFIGDSRCVQMREAVGGGGCSWICENAKGYKWLSETAIGQADPIVGKGTKVVVCLGVNDTGNAGNYAALINQKAAEWAGRGARTYFVSVNPVWTNPWVTEEQVTNFNASIAGQLSGVRYIDTHSVLINNGYVSVDGLHYDTNTYVTIFNLIAGSL